MEQNGNFTNNNNQNTNSNQYTNMQSQYTNAQNLNSDPYYQHSEISHEAMLNGQVISTDKMAAEMEKPGCHLRHHSLRGSTAGKPAYAIRDVLLRTVRHPMELVSCRIPAIPSGVLAAATQKDSPSLMVLL